MNGFKSLAVAGVLAVSLSAQANLIQNNSFESGDFSVALGGVKPVSAGNEAITSWTIGGGTIDWLSDSSGHTTPHGDKFVDLAGPEPGTHWVTQSLTTTAGQHYTVTFNFARQNCGCGSASGTFQAYVGSTQEFSLTSDSNLPWVTYSFGFVAATGATSTLKFQSITAAPQYVFLDNISVSAVPEPETYALMLAGLGALGFIARRRRMH